MFLFCPQRCKPFDLPNKSFYGDQIYSTYSDTYLTIRARQLKIEKATIVFSIHLTNDFTNNFANNVKKKISYLLCFCLNLSLQHKDYFIFFV